jgi:hypothetical protein
MNAIKVETTVDEATARAIPALRPLLGQRVELIALETQREPAAEPPGPKLTVDELFAAAVKPPPGTPPLTEEDIQRAIIEGALRGNV